MTIEIHQPELESLIQQRMASGQFISVEDFLLQILKSSPPVQEIDLEHATGALLVEAMQRSPHKDIEFESPPYFTRVREPVSFE